MLKYQKKNSVQELSFRRMVRGGIVEMELRKKEGNKKEF